MLIPNSYFFFFTELFESGINMEFHGDGVTEHIQREVKAKREKY